MKNKFISAAEEAKRNLEAHEAQKQRAEAVHLIEVATRATITSVEHKAEAGAEKAKDVTIEAASFIKEKFHDGIEVAKEGLEVTKDFIVAAAGKAKEVFQDVLQDDPEPEKVKTFHGYQSQGDTPERTHGAGDSHRFSEAGHSPKIKKPFGQPKR